MRFPSFSGRAVGALIVALGVTVACGGDDATDDGGAAGESNAAGRGGSSAMGGSSGSGGTSGGGNEAGESSGGSMSSPKGTFDSVWKQSQAEVVTFGLSGGIPTEATVDLPALYPVPETDSEVEMYQSIRDGVLLTYAHVVDAPSYYLVKSPLTAVDDGYYLSLGLMSGLYTLEDGILTFATQFSTPAAVGMSTSRFEPYTGDFPPPDWPSEMVELDLTTGGAP